MKICQKQMITVAPNNNNDYIKYKLVMCDTINMAYVTAFMNKMEKHQF